MPEINKGFNKADYTAAYNKANYHSYSIRFNNASEADIIRRITEEGGPKDYITRLIRADIKARERRNPRILTPRSGKRPPKKQASYQHNHINEYPLEILEQLPGGGYRSIDYAMDMDDAAVTIMKYCDRGTPAGAIVIARREVLRHGHKYVKVGTVYAKK